MRLPVAALLLASQPLAAQPTPQASLTLFSERFYAGEQRTIAADDPDARPGFVPRSFRVTGQWQICSQARYRGRCVDLEKDYPLDAGLGITFPIRSLRSTGGLAADTTPGSDDGYPSPNVLPGGPSLTGLAARFFPAPTYGRDRALACPVGKLHKNAAGARCSQRSAEDLCRRIGYRHARAWGLQIDRNRVYLADVLCTKN